jgi:hypothetical protein
MKIGKTVRQAGPKVQKRGHGAIHYAIISVGGAGHDSFKQTQHASHAVDAIQRRNEMHFGRAGIRETTFTPPATSVRARLSAPFIGLSGLGLG